MSTSFESSAGVPGSTGPVSYVHRFCSIFEPCEANDAATCPLEPTRVRRAEAKRGEWSALELRRETGGQRHYLDGRPIHCGSGLELQTRAVKSDDYGEFTVPVQAGTVVRYEASWVESLTWSLHVDVGGHEFSTPGEPWMRFRWPRGDGR